MAIRLRTLTEDEQLAIDRLANSRTAPARTVERARIVRAAADGRRVRAIALHLHIHAETVRVWVKRFNHAGLAGLHDAPRSGCPPTYTPEVVGEVIAAAMTKPQSLWLPFASWTLDRLEAYFNEERGIPIRRSRIDDLLIAEGLRWRTEETWFGERARIEAAASGPETGAHERPVDPAFAEKRGSSAGCTPLRPPAA